MSTTNIPLVLSTRAIVTTWSTRVTPASQISKGILTANNAPPSRQAMTKMTATSVFFHHGPSPLSHPRIRFFSSMKAAFSFFILGSVLNAIQALGFFLHFFYPSSVYASKGPVTASPSPIRSSTILFCCSAHELLPMQVLSLINSALVFFCYLIAFPCAYGGSRDYVDYLSRQSTSVNLEFGLSSGLFSAAFGVQFLLLLASIYGMAGECKSEAERRSTMVGETVTLPGELTTKSFETAASTESQVRDCC